MSTVSCEQEIKNNITNVSANWWVVELWDKKAVFSQAFPNKPNSNVQFRIQAKLVAMDTVLQLSFCLWSDNFLNSNEPIIQKVNVYYPTNNNPIEAYDTNNTLQFASDLTCREFTILKYNDWNNIATYMFKYNTNAGHGSNMTLKLYFKYEDPINYDSENMANTLTLPKFVDLFTDETFCDITIQAGDGTIKKAHKTVLITHSTVLQTLIKPYTDEKQSHLPIEELDKLTMNMFIKFLYTGVLESLELKEAKILMTVAHKFKVSVLKLYIQDIMYKMLTVDNAIDILINASENKAHQLKSMIMIYIQEKGICVFKRTPDWNLLKNQPTVAFYMLENFYY